MSDFYLKIKGVKIHYVVVGQGKPALFLHGHRSDTQRFKGIFEKLGRKYKIYAPDLPGFGKSEELPTFHSLENYFPYIVKLVNELNLGRFTLMAASMGVALANLLALEMPERVEKAVFLAPIFDRSSFKIPKFKYLPVIFLISAFPKRRFLVKLVNSFIRNDKFFKNFLKFFFPPEARKPQVLDYEVRQWRVMDIRVWAQTLGSLLTFKIPDKKRKLKIKATLIFTEEDQYVDMEKTIKSFGEIYSPCEVVTLPGIKHIPKGDIGQVFEKPEVKKLFERI